MKTAECIEGRFTIITDDPPPEVAAAGHDRCPIMLSVDGAQRWLSAESLKRTHAYDILGLKACQRKGLASSD